MSTPNREKKNIFKKNMNTEHRTQGGGRSYSPQSKTKKPFPLSPCQ